MARQRPQVDTPKLSIISAFHDQLPYNQVFWEMLELNTVGDDIYGGVAYSARDDAESDYHAIAFGPDGEIWFGASRFQPAPSAPSLR